MKVKADLIQNPTIHLEIDVSLNEGHELSDYLSGKTGVNAPNCLKELLFALRQKLTESKQ